MHEKDLSRLWDMLDAARAVTDFVENMTFAQFVTDRKTRNAVERNLEIIGEAAGRVSEESRLGAPEIPWRSIIGLRNVLAHEYGDINQEIIWSVSQDKLPALIRSLEALGADKAPE